MEELFTDEDFDFTDAIDDPAAILGKIGIYALKELAKSEEAQQYILTGAQSIDDWIQVKTGNVSNRNLEETIQLALDSTVLRDDKTIQQIISIITTLYATTNVNRGAIVGGTLLKEFGSDVFPHIDEKELRFAVPINQNLLKHVSQIVEKTYSELMTKYDLKNYATFSDGLQGHSSINMVAAPTDMVINIIKSFFGSK